VITCSESGEPTTERPRPLVGRTSVSFGWARSHLFFFDGQDATLDKFAAVASSDLFFGKFTVTLGAGSMFEGTLQAPGGTRRIGPGWVGAAGLSWRVLDEEESIPYLVFSATAGAAATSTRIVRPEVGMDADERGNYIGVDFRFGATLGKTFFGWLSPYVALRAFGGPIFWTVAGETRFGMDKYHVQGGLGSVFILPGGFDIFVEGNPGGEQGAFGGVGVRY
jgi:hypothetical protein